MTSVKTVNNTNIRINGVIFGAYMTAKDTNINKYVR